MFIGIYVNRYNEQYYFHTIFSYCIQIRSPMTLGFTLSSEWCALMLKGRRFGQDASKETKTTKCGQSILVSDPRLLPCHRRILWILDVPQDMGWDIKTRYARCKNEGRNGQVIIWEEGTVFFELSLWIIITCFQIKNIYVIHRSFYQSFLSWSSQM